MYQGGRASLLCMKSHSRIFTLHLKMRSMWPTAYKSYISHWSEISDSMFLPKQTLGSTIVGASNRIPITQIGDVGWSFNSGLQPWSSSCPIHCSHVENELEDRNTQLSLYLSVSFSVSLSPLICMYVCLLV